MNITDIYQKRHAMSNRKHGFSILGQERGELLSKLIGQGKTILDLGCRDGTLTSYFMDGNQVFGVVVDNNAIENAIKIGIEAKYLDLNGEWGFTEKFNVVVAGEILEHLYFPEAIIKKASEAGTMFIGSVPNAFSLKNRMRLFLGKKKRTTLYDPTHINHFHIEELRKMLEKYFAEVEIVGLGKHKLLAKYFPGLCAFDLFWVAKN